MKNLRKFYHKAIVFLLALLLTINSYPLVGIVEAIAPVPGKIIVDKHRSNYELDPGESTNVTLSIQTESITVKPPKDIVIAIDISNSVNNNSVLSSTQTAAKNLVNQVLGDGSGSRVALVRYGDYASVYNFSTSQWIVLDAAGTIEGLSGSAVYSSNLSAITTRIDSIRNNLSSGYYVFNTSDSWDNGSDQGGTTTEAGIYVTTEIAKKHTNASYSIFMSDGVPTSRQIGFDKSAGGLYGISRDGAGDATSAAEKSEAIARTTALKSATTAFSVAVTTGLSGTKLTDARDVMKAIASESQKYFETNNPSADFNNIYLAIGTSIITTIAKNAYVEDIVPSYFTVSNLPAGVTAANGPGGTTILTWTIGDIVAGTISKTYTLTLKSGYYGIINTNQSAILNYTNHALGANDPNTLADRTFPIPEIKAQLKAANDSYTTPDNTTAYLVPISILVNDPNGKVDNAPYDLRTAPDLTPIADREVQDYVIEVVSPLGAEDGIISGFDLSTGFFTYTPNSSRPAASGLNTYTVSFTYRLVSTDPGKAYSSNIATVTITVPVPELTNVSVSKTWVGPVAGPVTINLLADGVATDQKLTLSSANGWADKFINLPKYTATGAPIAYTITEDAVPNYSTAITGSAAAGFVVTNTNTEKVEVPVSKVWDGPVAGPVTINLLAGGVATGQKLTLSSANSWADKFTNLPKYTATGALIAYTITEDAVPNYSTAITGSAAAGFVVTNTNTETVNKTIVKVWDDGNNQDGIRPTDVYVQLKAGSSDIGPPVVLNDSCNWSCYWNNLPKYSAGQLIVYSVVETNVPSGYAVSYSEIGNAFTVTNTHIPEVVSISVSKVWVDGNNQDGIRPASVNVQLKVGDANIGPPITLDEDNDWSNTWNNLPKYSAGQMIVYSVVETSVPTGYAVGYSMIGNAFTVTNTHIPDVVSKSVTKIWIDNEDEYGIRPDSITVQLMADGTNVGQAVTLDEENDWSYTWNNLPKFNAGKEIVYTVEEIDAVPGYSTIYSADTFTITNTYISEPALSIVKDVKNISASVNEPFGKYVVFDEGEIARYRLVVKNDGNVTLYNVVVSDDQVAPLTPVEISGVGVSAFDANAELSLGTMLPGATITILYDYVTRHADIERSPIENIATVTGMTAREQVLTDEDSATIEVNGIPLGLAAIQITKQVKNETAGGAYADLANGFIGDKFNYIITVTNTGNTKLSNVVLTDNKVAVGTAVLINGGPAVGAWINIGGVASIVIGDMESGASVSFSYSYTSVAADEGDTIINTATVNAVYKPEREGYEDVPLTDNASAAIAVVGIPITGETGNSTATGLALILAGVVALILRRRYGHKQMDI